MSYKEKLKTKKWKSKRDEILNRDRFKCTNCNSTDFSKTEVWVYDEEGNPEFYYYDESCDSFVYSKVKDGSTWSYQYDINSRPIIPIMNVHHKKYFINREPWNYNNDDLITLCSDCHKQLHKKEKIPLFNDRGEQVELIGKCSRCKGYGYIPKYSHIQSGICFKCWGEGIDIEIIDFNEE